MNETGQGLTLSAPASIEEIAADGAIAQAAVDEAIRVVCGSPRTVDYLPAPGGYLAELSSPKGRWRLRGTTVATIEGDLWTWVGEPAFDIPELAGSWPVSPSLVDAARCVNGNGPLWFVRNSTGADAVVFDAPFTRPAPRHAIALGLARLAPDRDAARAVAAYAAWAGLGLRQEGSSLLLSSGDVIDGGALRPLVPTVTRNPALAREQDMFFDAAFPDRTVSYANGTLTVDNRFAAPGVVVAAVDSTHWRWSYFCEDLAELPWAFPARGLKRYGIESGELDLLRESIPRDEAAHLDATARAVLGLWQAVWVPDDERQLLVLFGALNLPPLRSDVARAVLSGRAWEGDEVEAYARARGIVLLPTDAGYSLAGLGLRREGERLLVEN